MILYHFTAAEYLDDILREGLTKGDVPTSAIEGINAVWLTSDRSPQGHGLHDGGEVSFEEKATLARMGRMAWADVDRSAFWPNKRAIQLTVKIPAGDRNLAHWPKWGRKRLTADWYATLDDIGGGKSKTWFIYRGTIPPEWIVKVERL